MQKDKEEGMVMAEKVIAQVHEEQEKNKEELMHIVSLHDNDNKNKIEESGTFAVTEYPPSTNRDTSPKGVASFEAEPFRSNGPVMIKSKEALYRAKSDESKLDDEMQKAASTGCGTIKCVIS